ncbi:MAG: SDR family oxidoreductase [Filimonas sp.]|nr:SDR family oxidoreductase [Filimonas sp.]
MQRVDNNKQFHGLWAIILGGSSGFGLATVRKLAKHGMNVALLYRETAAAEKKLKAELAALADEAQVQILPFNINALEEGGRTLFIQQFTEKIGDKKCVRLLLHSIARGNLKPLVAEEGDVLSAEDLQLTAYAMSNSMLDWARLLLQENLFAEEARVIGLTSEGAHKHWDSYAAVSIAKASIESLATYMAVEFAKYGLRTNIVQAGITATPSLQRIPGSKELMEYAETRNPLGRMTTPSDVADVIYLLCTNEARWINGALLHVDGGEHCK